MRTARAAPLGPRLVASLLVAALAGALAVAGTALAQTSTAGSAQPAAQAAAPAAASGAANASAGADAGASATAAATAGDVEISQRAFAIAGKLRCPVCTAESVADSSAEISAEMRTLIQQQLDAGKSEAQIIHYFRQRYGDWILLDPPKRGVHLLVWLLPALALLAGAAALALLVRRWRAAAEATPQADAEALARVRRALAGQTRAGADAGEDAHDAPGERA